MIKILTLFLGLSTGVLPVHLDVPTSVSSVEVILNGVSVQVVEGPPWSFDLDLGDQLLPHHLTVVGRDGQGEELGRDHRLINLDRFGHDSLADLCEAPCKVTSVAVEIDGKPPAVEAMDGWFLARGEPLRVLALHRGPAEIVVVRDPAAQEWLVRMAEIFLKVEASVPVPSELSGAVITLDREAFKERINASFQDSQSRHRMIMAWEAWQRFLRLDAETSVRFLSPVAAPASTVEKRRQIFNITSPLDAEENGMLFHLARIRPLEFDLRISDAAALAGLEAHGSRARRAVLLLLTDVSPGRTRYQPRHVRQYLEALGVPLFVWSFEQPLPEWSSTQIIDYRDQRETISPSESRDILRRLGAGFEQIRDSLEGQRVVWLEGGHLPQDIKLSPRADGIRLAGGQRQAGGQ